MPEFLTTDKMREILAPVPQEQRQSVVDELVSRGHEIEGLNAQFSPLETVVNIPGSLMEFGKSIWKAVTSPVETVESISALGRGALRVGYENITGTQLPDEKGVGRGALGGSAADEEVFRGMVDFYKERYGSVDRILNTIEQDPAGFLSDAASLVGGAGTVVKGAGTVGKVSALENIGGALAKGSRALDPVTAIPKTVKVVTKPVRKAVRQFNEVAGVNKLLRDSSNIMMADAIAATRSQRKNITRATHSEEMFSSFMAKHGVTGSLEMMKAQLNYIADATYNKVDEVLGNIDGKYKPRDAKVLLNEIRNKMTTEFEDVYRIDDVVTETTKGKRQAGFQSSLEQTVTETKKTIPSEQRNLLNIPKENLSTDLLNDLDEINGLIKKFDGEGLTLSEINRVKRITDEFLTIYKTTGEAKTPITFKNLDKARKRVRGFIEDEAARKGQKNIRELNQQTALAKGSERVIDDQIAGGRIRSPWVGRIQSMILLGGGYGIGSGDLGYLAAAAGFSGLLEIGRLPKVKSYFSTRLRLLADGEFQPLLEGIQSGKPSAKAQKILQRERKLFRKAFPELRLAGIAQQQGEEQ